MADNEAKITISAQDNASPVVEQVAQKFSSMQGILEDIRPYMDGANQSMADIAASSTGAIGSIDSLTAELKQLTAEFNALAPESEAFVQHAQDIQVVKGRLDELQGSAKPAAEAMGGLNLSMVSSVAGALGLVTTFQAAAGAVKEFASASVEAASQMQIIDTKAEVLFGSDLPQMNAAITDMADSLHRSTEEIGGFVTSADMFTTSMGLGKEQAEQMGLGMADLAVKIGQATGTDEQEGFNKLEMALRGFGRGLTEVGVDLDQHRLQTYLDAEGIDKQYSSLDDASKAMVAYAYLLSQQGPINEMAAKNMDGVAEATKEANAQWQQAEITFGKPISHAWTGFMQDLASLAGEAATSVQYLETLLSTGSIQKAQQAIGATPLEMPKTPDGPQTEEATFTGTYGLTDEQYNNMKFLEQYKNYLKDIPSAGGGGSSKIDELKNSLDTLSGKYDDTTASIQTKLNDLDNTHQTTMQSDTDSMTRLQESLTTLDQTYQDKVASIQKTLTDLKSSFDDTMQGITKSEEDALATQGDKIDQLKQKLADLQLRAQQEDRKGSVSAQTNEDIAQTQAELTKEQASNTTQMGKLTPDQQAAVAARQAMTDTDKTIADKEQEAQDKLAKYNEDVANAQKDAATAQTNYDKDRSKAVGDISQLQTKMDTEQRAYGLQRSQLVETQSKLLDFKNTLDAAMNGMGTVTKEQLKGMSDDLADFGKTLDKGTAELEAKNYEGVHAQKAKDATTSLTTSHTAQRDQMDQTGKKTDDLASKTQTGFTTIQDVATKAITAVNSQLDLLIKKYVQATTLLQGTTPASTAGLGSNAPTAPVSGAYVNPNYVASVDGSQAYLNATRVQDTARAQAQQTVNIEIQMGQVTVHSQDQIDAMVDSLTAQLARQMQLQAQGVN